MIDITNLIVGGLVVIINLIPLIMKNYKLLRITIPLSLLIVAIKFLFLT